MEVSASSQLWQQLQVQLPPLFTTVLYYDDFSDMQLSMAAHEDNDTWKLTFDGQIVSFDFSIWTNPVKRVLQHWCVDTLRSSAPGTTATYMSYIRSVPSHWLVELLHIGPSDIRVFWNSRRAIGMSYHASVVLKSLLNFLCDASIGAWDTEWKAILSLLELPTKDKYASIRTGDVFLDTNEEAALVEEIDRITHIVQTTPDTVDYDTILETCVLVCSYQFGMRRKQIAMLQVNQVRIWQETDEQFPAIHLTFTMIKQSNAECVLPLPRKVKREWGRLFIEFLARVRARQVTGTDTLAAIASPPLG
jgi:hypothetical protein